MIQVTDGTTTIKVCPESRWAELLDADVGPEWKKLVEKGFHESAEVVSKLGVPRKFSFLERIRVFASKIGAGDPVAVISRATKLETLSSLERASRREMLQEAILLEEKVRAPVGYTKTSPLVVNGKPYVGGQFIPGATSSDVQRAVERQTKKDQASQSPAVIQNRRARAIARINSQIPAEENMFNSNLLMPVDQAIANRNSEADRIIRTIGRDTVLRTANLTQNDFLAGRETLSRQILIDRLTNGSDGQSPALVIRNADKSYTIVAGHQRIVAGLMLGEPTIPAKVMNRADLDAQFASIDHHSRPATAPAAASPVTQPATPTHSMGTFGHSPTAVGAWMGVNGWSTQDARRVLRARGVEGIRDSTFSALLSRGRNGIGIVAPLTPSQADELNRMRASNITAPRSRSGIVAPATRPDTSQVQALRAELAATRQPSSRPNQPIAVMSDSDRAALRAREQPMESIKRIRAEYREYKKRGMFPPGEWRVDWDTAKARALALPENQANQAHAPTIDRTQRTPEQRQQAREGAEAARQQVERIRNMDASNLPQLQRPDRASWASVTVDRNASEFMKQHGAALSGAPPGSHIEVGPTTNRGDHDFTTVTVSGPHGLTMERHVYTPKRAGEKGHVYNSYFQISESAPDGVGALAFSSQVAELQHHGIFNKIEVTAGGQGNHIDGSDPGAMNGYYTWPRFGYTGLLPRDVSSGQYGLPMNMRDVQRVEEMMTTKEGRDWWRKNGTQERYEFDLNPNSYSSKYLRNYMNERGRT